MTGGIAMGNMLEIDAGRLVRHAPSAPPVHLTSRQSEVLALLCEGLPNKLISRQLNIAEATVKIHVAHILRALNVSSRLQAVVAARDLGFERKSGNAEPLRREMAAAPRCPDVLRLLLNDADASRMPAADADWSLAVAAG
jgi:DNA-binding CsgD family transcriptional regulator